MVVLPNGELDWRCGRDEPEVKINACYRILRFRFHHQNQVVHNGQFQGIQCPLLTSMGTCVHGVHIYICKKTHEIKYNLLENRILSTYVVICRNILFFFYMSMDTFKPIVPKMFPQIHHVLEMKFQINITEKKEKNGNQC